MKREAVKVLLLAAGVAGGQRLQDTLAAFFGACGVEAEVVDYAGRTPVRGCDAAIVMGNVGAGAFGGATLEKLRSYEIPVVFFGVGAGADGPPDEAWMDYASLVSARDAAFMRAAKTYAEVIGDPCESLEALGATGAGFKREGPQLEKQMVFVSRILELIRQRRVLNELKGLQGQDAFNKAERSGPTGISTWPGGFTEGCTSSLRTAWYSSGWVR